MNAGGFPAVHIAELVQLDADDTAIWRLAAKRSDVIVTKDADFAGFVVMSGTTQAVVWLRMGNTRSRALIGRIIVAMPQIILAHDAGERLIEVR